MSTAARHLEFAPPPTPGLLRALGLAIAAHAVLLAVLTLGVQWKRDAEQPRFEAELWSSVPVQAAPPAPLPVPEEAKPVPPAPKPQAKPEPAPADTKAQADIALLKEKEKAKQLLEKKLALEKAELEKKKIAELEKQKQAKLEQEKKDKLKKEQADKDKRKQEQLEAQQLEAQRKQAIKRMEGLAGAGGNGAPGTNSSALESMAISNSYAGRIRSYIKRFHTYTETISGNPTTEIEVRLASDGSVLSRRITKPSGTKSWDDAALNAIDKAEKLPLNENGRAPPSMTIVWSAQDVAR